MCGPEGYNPAGDGRHESGFRIVRSDMGEVHWVRVLNGTVKTALALMFHEMAANAVRYGALPVPSGRLSLHWSCEADHVTLQLGCTT